MKQNAFNSMTSTQCTNIKRQRRLCQSLRTVLQRIFDLFSANFGAFCFVLLSSFFLFLSFGLSAQVAQVNFSPCALTSRRVFPCFRERLSHGFRKFYRNLHKNVVK